MSGYRSGVTGRYQARCGNGLCALTGGQATSKMQGSLFTLLNYVIGGGREDVEIPLGPRPARLDMVFDLPGDFKLVVEYDGAYWHCGREEQDFAKSGRAMDWYGQCIAVRVREYPLEPGRYLPDVQVPARVDAATCARLVMLHLLHVLPLWSHRETQDRMVGSLLSAAGPLDRWTAAACCAGGAFRPPTTSGCRQQTPCRRKQGLSFRCYICPAARRRPDSRPVQADSTGEIAYSTVAYLPRPAGRSAPTGGSRGWGRCPRGAL